ncbi:Protein GAL3 [Smittium culicis]|uniref:Protein GAL3 n=1 Tax=Smittium culicis TaxID=133412 RepID=A0A1R1X4V4_9FUNG|nr:Protein GAL3 [Smittium culicis]
MLAKALNLQDDDVVSNANPLTMKIIMDALHNNQDIQNKSDVEIWIERLNTMLKHTDEIFGDHPDGYTWEQCADYLNLSVEELKLKIRADLYPIRADYLQIFRRTKHVFSETLRVVKFRQTCEESTSADVYNQLGSLMNDSQESCDKLFDCSCTELNELCQIARESGSIGSRLTGAGWGGCTISLVPESMVDNFIKDVKEKYYGKRYPNLTQEELNNSIFSTRPGSGMYLYSV